ncbi:tyrosine-type recombinase/integrase [Paenibacillus macquariensis]|uniref:Integrase/recombinase XerD n=1 Tax=Paenibacillus macquariensis TaxID=948756 RepID=A0ABY1JKB8_9BACL|nr:tyrosine-type recombinase/integrase [Paenibacillus macquariensis]MEC0089897.1 tyrosine-type recombinase/integrase [Paenibacillus macquariensis]OAB30642.1 integrase [Paenibacillus macquariensis subsp. macquariensis]SIQ33849.1 integrase/recombinase XerD [Paenibacillus macquariensis]
MTDIEFQLDNFMLYCSSKNLSRKTLASYEQTLKLFVAYLKNEYQIEDIKKVQSGHIRHYIKYLRERGKYTVVNNEESKQCNHPENRKDYKMELSMTTIANYVRNIKVFFNYLYTVEREIPKNPVEKLENPKVERKMKKTITPEELKKVFGQFETSTFHGYRNRVISRILLDTGMRIGECLSILPENIDFQHKSIHITNAKNKQERFVYFSFKSANELKQWLRYKDRYSESPFMFPTTKGTKLDVRNFERALRDAGKKVGIHIHPHQLRNNFAKYYILNNGDWFSLCRILGHSSVEVTQKAYLDFSDEEIAKKYQKHSPLTFIEEL